MNNAITGVAGVNLLIGAAGNDTLDGTGGNDTLVGGTGADSYVFGRSWGIDTVLENNGTAGVIDQVLLGANIRQTDTVYRRNVNNLELTINGRTDKLMVRDRYLGP